MFYKPKDNLQEKNLKTAAFESKTFDSNKVMLPSDIFTVFAGIFGSFENQGNI
jgi:hypothetical protein